jgi:hypothetical protein
MNVGSMTNYIVHQFMEKADFILLKIQENFKQLLKHNFLKQCLLQEEEEMIFQIDSNPFCRISMFAA